MPQTADSLQVAYVMQNVGVDITSDVGQAILIKHTIHGLEQAGHRVSLLALQGRAVVGIDDLACPQETWTAPLGITGKRPFLLAESAIRRLQNQLRLPYLALFDSWRFYDACRHILPRFQICHEYAGLLSIGAALACWRTNTPYVLTVDADLLLERAVVNEPLHGVQAFAARRAALLTYRLADAIVCVSEPVRENLIHRWHVAPEKITVIPNGVDVSRFMQPVDTAVVRQKWQICAEAPVVMFVGGFQRWHGIDRLLEAFVRVRTAVPKAQLVLVGDGPARPETEAQITALGLQDAVTLTGMVPHEHVPELLAVADVVTIPYPKLPAELWFSPLKLYEYMAAGKAIVASKDGQIADVLIDEVNGRLVEPGNVTELAQAIIHLLQHPEDRERLGYSARQQAVARHSWQAQIGRLEAVYRQILGGHAT